VFQSFSLNERSSNIEIPYRDFSVSHLPLFVDAVR
jgi:hypothetical protein